MVSKTEDVGAIVLTGMAVLIVVTVWWDGKNRKQSLVPTLGGKVLQIDGVKYVSFFKMCEISINFWFLSLI